jgi:hypothetical protein
LKPQIYVLPFSFNTAGKIIVLCILIFFLLFYLFIYYKRGDEKTNYSKLNGATHSLNLICSQFLRECNFDLLLSFPNA